MLLGALLAVGGPTNGRKGVFAVHAQGDQGESRGQAKGSGVARR